MVHNLVGFAKSDSRAGLGSLDPEMVEKVGEPIAIFPAFPTYMGCVQTHEVEDIFSPMAWILRGQRGPAEVVPLLPAEVVYRAPHNDSVGSTWATHHREFGRFVAEHAVGEAIYEVGAAHGILSLEAQKHRHFHWTMHDLAPTPVPEYSGTIVEGAFNRDSARLHGECATLVHSHTLEHVHDPAEFMADIGELLPIGGRQIFSWPNMDHMLRAGELNFLNFEHTVFLPIRYVAELLTRFGFAIDAISHFRRHSIFIAATKITASASPRVALSRAVLTTEEHVAFDDYFRELTSKVERMNDALQDSQRRAFVFGAHVFTQMLIAAGLDTSRLSACLDNSRLKEGQRLYGTSLMVTRPEVPLATRAGHASKGRPLVVMAPSSYGNEIAEQLMTLTRGNCEIVT